MEDGTAEDFNIIRDNDMESSKNLAEKILNHLELLAEDDGAYPINRLEHCLQTATRAEKDGADEEWIVASLLHDLGDVLAPFSHAEVSYEILRPFVREEVAWVVKHHGIFQMKFNKALTNEQRNLYRQFEENPHFEAALRFVNQWDQASFDPNYNSYDIEHFRPMVERLFKDPFKKKANEH